MPEPRGLVPAYASQELTHFWRSLRSKYVPVPLPRRFLDRLLGKAVPIHFYRSLVERVYGQECSTGCKIKGQAVKEVTLNPLKDTPTANQFPAAKLLRGGDRLRYHLGDGIVGRGQLRGANPTVGTRKLRP